jgi:hypothetical protein
MVKFADVGTDTVTDYTEIQKLTNYTDYEQPGITTSVYVL